MELTQPIRFEWAYHPDDVWNSSPFHVDGLHVEVVQNVLAGVAAARRSDGPSPIGVAVQGARGAGKTHMLGWIREKVQADGGYFFLVSLLDSSTFWESAMLSVLDGLLRESDGRENQLKTFLRRLATQVGLSGGVLGAIAGDLNLVPDDLGTFIASIRRANRQVGVACQDTARALVLYASADQGLQDIGYNYLQSMEESESTDRATWGIQRAAKPAQQILRELSHLLALTGPSVIAIDQIDTLVAQSLGSTGEMVVESDTSKKLLFAQIANGLMGLREMTRRTLTVVTCLPAIWTIIRAHAVDTVPDRFREALQLEAIPSAEFGRLLIEKRLAAHYREIGFSPRYPTWPVLPSAFEDAMDFTPRGLMKAVGEHIDGCMRRGRIDELSRLAFVPGPESVPTSVLPPPPETDLDSLDVRFERIRKIVDVEPAYHHRTEDAVVPGLLSAGLEAFIEESKDLGRVLFQDAPPGKKALLHARLREDIDEETENETHWAFRAIASESPVAALNRIRAACTAAGLHKSIPGRKLFLLRNTPWSGGPKTQEALGEFIRAGGVSLRFEEDDLRTFAALKDLLSERDPSLKGWLADRKPATSTKLFQEVFGDLLGMSGEASPVPPKPEPSRASIFGPMVAVGRGSESGAPVEIDLESLRKHTTIFAGSGSGKTVLIRRMVEECALHGVSAIVLDPNNDLARLGDPWPESPENWSEGDAERAKTYIANTDVVVWTPGREGGRPVTLKPLPDFRSVLDDKDELNDALDAAVATLAPRAKVTGELSKAVQSRAVLREALQYFAKRGGSGLRHFISLLAELPEGISAIRKAEKLAAEMADTLTAAVVNDPLFGGEGETLDPGVLLTPPPGKTARISVISFVGLPSDDQRQNFVNQLQMALFAWIKKNPAGERPLGGLLVMDEAQTLAPSGAMTACTQSTLALASQARKYGLGLVFATQAPKGLHNRIAGNAATQFFGFLNSPVQIAAAREMAQAKGSEVLDISRLKSGQFYASGEGMAFQRIEARMCLSHHPRSPLTTEEVIERARRLQ